MSFVQKGSCYMYIGDCYSAPYRTERKLVMSGTFTPDDLYMVNIRLVEEDVL